MDNVKISMLLEEIKRCDVCGKFLTGKQQRFCSRACSGHNYARFLKHGAIDAYGGECVRCFEKDIDMLVLHHRNLDGTKFKKDNDCVGAVAFNLWLKNNKYPQDLGLQVLCCNHHAKEHVLINKAKLGGEIQK
ncbi:MAG: hypothetical protein GY853_00640 [PVC group bacterium]|nr:hypothetical protein [PVC group bacterium]